MAKQNDKHDWELIMLDYRAGPFSIREVAKKHGLTEGAIRKHAKKRGITRDLTDKVRKEIRIKLARTEAKPSLSDEEIIDTASDRGVKIVTDHRENILRHRQIALLLAGQLDEFAKAREEIEKTITDETKEDGDTKRRNQMLKAVSLPSHAGVLRDLSSSLKNLIPLERQAYNLGDSGVSLEEVLNALPRDFGDAVRRALGRIVSEEGD